MFPLKDENPSRRKPVLTLLLITLNTAIFFWSCFSGSFVDIVNEYGMKPSLISEGKKLHTLLTSMFLHGGFLHVGGNMLYLWIFGDNVEDTLGRKKFLIFYLLCGLAASLAHLLSDPSSSVPTIGASGAISGVLGAYLVLYPKARVLTAVVYFYFIRVIMVPALFFLGFWFVLQMLSASVLLVAGAPSGVAYWAHVGGFLAGMMAALPLRRIRR